MRETEIAIENARSHNLKGVSCRIPLGSLCVVTGVSGSGKSTLAFDTLYAEGQRRYVTSLSTYARQFLERLPRPEVDRISSLPPAIAIEQRNRVTNARSTVGTASEIMDHLRLLFARLGRTRCPDCDCPVEPGSVAAVAERIARRFGGRRVSLAAPLQRRKGESWRALRERLLRDGFGRLLDPEARVFDVAEVASRELARSCAGARLLIDRLALAADPDAPVPTRLLEAVSSAFSRGEGELFVVPAQGEAARYREGFACDRCGRRFAKPEPALFSFNSPLGACPSCQGFGRSAELDLDRIVPDPERSLEEHAVAPFATPMGRSLERELLSACRARDLPTDVPFSALDAAQRHFVFEGDGEHWSGVRDFFDWLEGRRYKVQARVLIARYRHFVTCAVCQGARLRPEALAVELGGVDIGQLARLTIDGLREWLEALQPSPNELQRIGRLLDVLRTRVATVAAVGLGYLPLSRQTRSLSGGEAQRIQLACALGGGLTSALYVLDEPSIGLHARDMQRLIQVLLAIRDQGNTLVVVEHAPEILLAADHVIDLGPGAGSRGGRLVVEGSLAEVRAHPDSQTARLLRGELAAAERRPRTSNVRSGGPELRIVGATQNNLDDLSVSIPLNCLVVVTGVSGAGKSTLVNSVLVGQLLDRPEARRSGVCRRVEGREWIDRVVVVDQTPAARNPRSNPATVSKAFDGIRARFAATREARALGLSPGWFSFNVAGGRCDACEGSGEIVIDMQFLDDVRAPCEVCGGLRYRRDVLDVRLNGLSIADVLALSIDEASEFFAEDAKIVSRLEPLRRVGLGYLGLGQPLTSLSGGENQRVRLASALAAADGRCLYVLDEPTTGLHAVDIAVLLECLGELIEGGGSVLVIEHNLDVVGRADWVIDLGPEGGPGGGRVVAACRPEQLVNVEESYTGRALRERSDGRERDPRSDGGAAGISAPPRGNNA